jgi:hypothetical protein
MAVPGGGRSRDCQGIRWSIYGEGGRRRKWDGVKGTYAIVPHNHALCSQILTDKPNGSNSIEQELPVVK